MKSLMLTAAAVILAATARAAPLVVREVAAGENVGDKAVHPIYYLIIAANRQGEAGLVTAKKRDLSEEEKEWQNAAILVSMFKGGGHGNIGDVSAYDDYVKDANPEEILGE